MILAIYLVGVIVTAVWCLIRWVKYGGAPWAPLMNVVFIIVFSATWFIVFPLMGLSYVGHVFSKV